MNGADNMVGNERGVPTSIATRRETPGLRPLRGETPVNGRRAVIVAIPHDAAQGRLRPLSAAGGIRPDVYVGLRGSPQYPSYSEPCQARSRASSGPADHAMRRTPEPTRPPTCARPGAP